MMEGDRLSFNQSNAEADFVQLITLHQPDLYVYIRSLVVDPESASDVLQETNRVLWEKRERFEQGSNFIAWSFAVARNKVKQFQSRRTSRGLRFDDELIDQLARRAEDSADLINARLSALRGCMGHMEDKDRQLIERRYAPGVAASDVAEEIGRPVGWVHTAVSRLRKRLLKCVNERLSREGWS